MAEGFGGRPVSVCAGMGRFFIFCDGSYPTIFRFFGNGCRQRIKIRCYKMSRGYGCFAKLPGIGRELPCFYYLQFIFYLMGIAIGILFIFTNYFKTINNI